MNTIQSIGILIFRLEEVGYYILSAIYGLVEIEYMAHQWRIFEGIF